MATCAEGFGLPRAGQHLGWSQPPDTPEPAPCPLPCPYPAPGGLLHPPYGNLRCPGSSKARPVHGRGSHGGGRTSQCTGSAGCSAAPFLPVFGPSEQLGSYMQRQGWALPPPSSALAREGSLWASSTGREVKSRRHLSPEAPAFGGVCDLPTQVGSCPPTPARGGEQTPPQCPRAEPTRCCRNPVPKCSWPHVEGVRPSHHLVWGFRGLFRTY